MASTASKTSKPKTATAATKTAAKAVKPAATKPAAKPVKAAAAKAAVKPAPAKAAAGKAAPAKARVTKPKVAKPAARPAITPDQRRCYVEVAAYYMAERRGFSGGNPVDDWAQAEAEVDRLLAEGLINP